MDQLLLLGSAGVIAGAMNAVTGGGSFVSLPALIAVGVPSVAANASSTVALWPGGAASVWVYRDGLRAVAGVPLAALAVVTLISGAIGGALLLLTPTILFDRLLPWLLLIATLALAFGPRLGVALRGQHRPPRAATLAVQGLLGVYGGYYGGAVGIMMMAAWSLLDGSDVKALNAPRTLMVGIANGAAVLCFAGTSVVYWREALGIGIGAVLGGSVGAWLGRRLPVGIVRAATLTLCTIITALFFVHTYR